VVNGRRQPTDGDVAGAGDLVVRLVRRTRLSQHQDRAGELSRHDRRRLDPRRSGPLINGCAGQRRDGAAPAPNGAHFHQLADVTVTDSAQRFRSGCDQAVTNVVPKGSNFRPLECQLRRPRNVRECVSIQRFPLTLRHHRAPSRAFGTPYFLREDHEHGAVSLLVPRAGEVLGGHQETRRPATGIRPAQPAHILGHRGNPGQRLLWGRHRIWVHGSSHPRHQQGYQRRSRRTSRSRAAWGQRSDRFRRAHYTTLPVWSPTRAGYTRCN
jgi:hypothetical protein